MSAGIEREPSPAAARVDGLLTRRAESEELSAMMRELKPLSAHGSVNLPKDAAGAIDPRIALVKPKELHANRGALRPLVDVESEEFVPAVTREIPALKEPIENVRARAVIMNSQRSRYRHFLSLAFEKKVVDRLKEEQLDIWHELPHMAGMDRDILEWGEYEPTMLVMNLDRGVKPKTVNRLEAHLKRQLPVTLTLLPVGEPRTAEI